MEKILQKIEELIKGVVAVIIVGGLVGLFMAPTIITAIGMKHAIMHGDLNPPSIICFLVGLMASIVGAPIGVILMGERVLQEKPHCRGLIVLLILNTIYGLIVF